MRINICLYNQTGIRHLNRPSFYESKSLSKLLEFICTNYASHKGLCLKKSPYFNYMLLSIVLFFKYEILHSFYVIYV
ncbi:unnamed protein product [Larinioides sclopetarius]|uniref:Uncharacterized protein n=1 Tax=Larinioides sclopetarius TaxID=280406 RepID=A0AAV2AJH9_9ARAC